jgi:hypothetical protein
MPEAMPSETFNQLTKVPRWQIGFANLYPSNPPAGVKTTDGIPTTELRFNFGKPL